MTPNTNTYTIEQCPFCGGMRRSPYVIHSSQSACRCVEEMSPYDPEKYSYDEIAQLREQIAKQSRTIDELLELVKELIESPNEFETEWDKRARAIVNRLAKEKA